MVLPPSGLQLVCLNPSADCHSCSRALICIYIVVVGQKYDR
jgi:hypothetical protein